jgi:hypothetical protein
VRAVLTGVEISEEELAPLIDEGDGPVVLVVDDGELLGVRVPRSSLGNNPTTGRGFLNDGSGELELVQVPAE